MSQRTISEEIFECYLKTVGVRFERIQVNSARTPDYRMTMADHLIIAEVKQIDPNNEDRRQMRLVEESGIGEPYGDRPGHRACRKLNKAARQVRPYAKGRYPAMVVLYDHVPFPFGGDLSPDHVMYAMHGVEALLLDPEANHRIVGSRFAGSRGVTPTHNTTISVVAVLSQNTGKSPRLDAFHNPHAELKIDPAWLRNTQTHHYELGKQMGGRPFWVRI